VSFFENACKLQPLVYKIEMLFSLQRIFLCFIKGWLVLKIICMYTTLIFLPQWFLNSKLFL
jgi:hypothetical protein